MTGSLTSTSSRTSLFTKVSVSPKPGTCHADPFSQNEPPDPEGKITFRSTSSLAGCGTTLTPGANRMPSHCVSGG